MTSPPQCGRPAALWSRVWGCGGKSLVSSCRAADLEALMVGPLFHLKDGEGSAELTSLQPLSCPLAHTETHIQPHTHTHTLPNTDVWPQPGTWMAHAPPHACSLEIPDSAISAAQGP